MNWRCLFGHDYRPKYFGYQITEEGLSDPVPQVGREWRCTRCDRLMKVPFADWPKVSRGEIPGTRTEARF